jgi:hypothetical protein
MSIVDAQGRPVRPTLSEEDIINTFNQIVGGMQDFEQRLHIIQSQMTHSGLIIEFMISKLKKHDIKFDDAEFAKYAQDRIEEIRAEAEAVQQEQENLKQTAIRLDDDE